MPEEKDKVTRLIGELKHKNRGRRADAAWELGQIGDPEAVLPLCQALEEWSPWDDAREMVRDAVAAALVKIGAPSVLPLCAVLKEGNPGARERAVEALGKIGDPRAVLPLCEALRDRRIWDGRAKVAAALDRIGAPAVAPLCELLREASVEVLAAATLGRIGEGLRDQGVHVCSLAAAALGRIGDARAVPALCAALSEKHWRVSCSAAIALGEIGEPEAVAPLCEALQQSSPDLRYHTVVALGQIGDPRAVLPLYGARRGMNAAGRARVAEALSRIVRRAAAAEALVHLGAAVVLPVCEVLKAGNSEARCQAAKVLARIAERKPVPALRAAIPHLRALAPWRAQDGQEAHVCQMALERIEAATAVMALPLPAAAPPPSPEELPIPAAPPVLAREELPIPAGSPGLPHEIPAITELGDGIATAGKRSPEGALALLAGTVRRFLRWLRGLVEGRLGGRQKLG